MALWLLAMALYPLNFLSVLGLRGFPKSQFRHPVQILLFPSTSMQPLLVSKTDPQSDHNTSWLLMEIHAYQGDSDKNIFIPKDDLVTKL